MDAKRQGIRLNYLEFLIKLHYFATKIVHILFLLTMVDEKLIKKIIVEYILLEKMMDGKIYGANHRSLPVNSYHVESIVKRIIDYVDEIPSELFSTNEQIRIRDIKQALKIDLLCQDKEEVQRQLKVSIDEIINILKSRLSI